MEKLSKKAKRSGLYTIGGKLVTPLINFLILAFIIRTLTVEEYGAYNILISFMAAIGVSSSLGLPNILTRFIPEFHHNNQFSNIKALVLRGLLLRLALSSSLIIVVSLFSGPIFKLFNFSYPLEYFLFFAITILCHLEFVLMKAVLSSLFLHQFLVLSQITFFTLRAGLIYLYLIRDWGLKGLIFGEAIAYVVLLALCGLAYWTHYLRRHEDTEPATLPARRILRFGAFSQLNDLGVQILSLTTDFFVISAFLGARAVGLYGFATKLVQLIANILPHKMLEDVIKPVFYSKYVANQESFTLVLMYNMIMKIIGLTIIPVVVVLFLEGDNLIRYFFDEKYLEGVAVLKIVAVFYGLNALMLPVGLVLYSLERADIVLYSKIFAIYNLVGDLLVVESYGIVGIALVTSSAELFKNLFCYYYTRKYISLRLDIRGLAKIAINALAIGIFIKFASVYVVSATSFVVMLGAAAIVYLVASYLNKPFTEDERSIINKVLPKPIFVF